MALARKYRLTKEKDIKNVFSKGKTFRVPLFFIKCTKNDLDHSRIAVVISKKVSNKATVRNLIRRRIHEVLNTSCKKILSRNLDMTITAIPTIVGKDFKEIKSSLEQTTNSIRSK